MNNLFPYNFFYQQSTDKKYEERIHEEKRKLKNIQNIQKKEEKKEEEEKISEGCINPKCSCHF